MLVSAKFENIYSFNEETRILFTASKSDLLPLHVSRAEKRDDISVLRMGLIKVAIGYFMVRSNVWLVQMV